MPNKQSRRKEIYWSLLFGLIGLNSAGTLPQGYWDQLIATGAFSIAFFCAVNALLDFRNMPWWERALAIFWLALLLSYAPFYVWQAAHYTDYADR